MYGRKANPLVLETRNIEEWEKVYEIARGKDESYKPRFWDLLRVHLKDGFRQQHLYISMFFPPLLGYTRPQRVTVIFTILFISLAVNAFLFQYDSNQEISIESRGFAAVISSLIVFVPTTIHGYLFRRCRRRTHTIKYIYEFTLKDYEELGVDVSKVSKRNFFERWFLDWHLPWWWSCILYFMAYASWVFSIYVTLLYGISFRDDKAIAYFESFLISLAMSIVVLQTAKAFIGGVFTTFTSGVVSVAVLAALGAGNLFAMQ